MQLSASYRTSFRKMASFRSMLRDQLKEWVERNIRVPNRARIVASERKEADVEQYLKSHICPNPFTTLETTPSGLAYVCCPAWLPTPIGNIASNLAKVWAGDKAEKIRQSILDGSYSYCSRVHCPAITNRFLVKKDSPEAQQILSDHAKGSLPKRIILSHDRSCNLSCPSCRKDNIIADKAKQKRFDDLIEDSILPALKEAETVYVTGSGDPFGSNHFRRLLKRLTGDEFPKLTIDLHTNGQLFDERAWNDIGLSGRVGYVHISIDAAEPGTYAIVRRGGTFERLLMNLAFVRHLRQTGEIRQFEISMVVQACNFRQMPAFVRIGKEFAADTISFNMIQNWGIMSEDEFAAAYVGSSDHPDHEKLERVLEAPEMRFPEVRAGNILSHVKRSKPQIAAH